MASAFSISGANAFQGNDGPWYVFQLGVGTPSQTVSVLPASSVQYIVVIYSLACSPSDPSLSTCTQLRGGLYDPYNSHSWTNLSDSVAVNGQFKLPFPYESGLFPLQCTDGDCDETSGGYFGNASSLLGTETVNLAHSDGQEVSLDPQLIAPYDGGEPILGLLGLYVDDVDFPSVSYPSPLQHLWDNDLTPSRYWAYNAGSYRQNLAGSLTIGGYDRNRGDIGSASYWDLNDSSQDLTVEISNMALMVSGTLSSNFSFATQTSAYISASIDTTVPELWLPEAACKAFELAFGLTWDESLYMYLVNGTHHETLLADNPSVTFELGGFHGSSGTQAFTLSYSSFDLQVSWPLGGNSDWGTWDYYFPLKRATDAAHNTLGRAFLQETYLAVDYDLQRFYLTPAQFTDSVHLVTINHRKHSGLGAGAIAGIVVGCIVGLAMILIPLFLLWRKRRDRKRKESWPAPPAEKRISELTTAPPYSDVDVDTVAAKRTSELDVKQRRASELPSPGLSELPSPHLSDGAGSPNARASELESPPGHARTLSNESVPISSFELATAGSRRSGAQSPGGRASLRYELDAQQDAGIVGMYEMQEMSTSPRSPRSTSRLSFQ